MLDCMGNTVGCWVVLLTLHHCGMFGCMGTTMGMFGCMGTTMEMFCCIGNTVGMFGCIGNTVGCCAALVTLWG